MDFMKLVLLLIFFGSVGATGSEPPDHADPVAVVDPVEIVKANLAEHSKALGLSPSTYKYALDQYERLYSGDEVPAMPMVHQIPELISPKLYSEQEVIAAMNKQQAKFASFLGVPVAQLEPFLINVADFLEPALVNKKRRATKSMEEVVVFCIEACGQSSYIDLSLMVYQAATAANIPNLENYQVRFFNPGNTTQPASVEVWRHNNFGGANRIRVISRPCPTCPYN